MKWTNHKLVTGAAVATVTGNLFFAIAAMLGAVLPDLIEGMVPEPETSAYDQWHRQHRRTSHWIPLYLIPGIGCAVFMSSYFPGFFSLGIFSSAIASSSWLFIMSAYKLTPFFTAICLLFVMIGGICHILEDALCGKVPTLFSIRRRFGLSLFRVGSFGEYLLSYLFVLLCLAIRVSFSGF